MRHILVFAALTATTLLAACGRTPAVPTQPSAATTAPGLTALATGYNPNNFDTAKIMEAINHPKPDLVILSSHRGLHALVDGTYPNVPENSLQAVGLAAQAGFEEVEIDVKLTSDGIPVLSHDTTWGRETNCCFYPDQGPVFDPFGPHPPAQPLDPQNEFNNPRVESLSLRSAQSYRLRDSINRNWNGSSESPSSLQQLLDYMTSNKIAMVLALDLRDARVASASWAVIANSKDYLGRSYAASTLFKIPAKAFTTPADVEATFAFGPGAGAANFQPVYNTGDIAPGAIADNLFGGIDVPLGPSGYGSEDNIIKSLQAFENDPNINVTAVEIQIKQQGGILTSVLNAARNNSRTGQPASITVFSPYVDYFAPSDTGKTNPLFYQTNGYCCVPLSNFYYNGTPNNQPSDTADNRGNLDYLVQQSFNSVTTDNPEDYNARLAALGKRNISYMQGNTPPPGPPLDPLPPPTVGETTIRKPDPSVIQVGNAYYSVEQVNNNAVAVRGAGSLEGLSDASPVVIWSDPGIKEVWAPEIERIAGRYYVYFAAGAGAAHRMYVIESKLPDSGYTGAQAMALPDDKWAIDGTTFVFYNERYFVWSGWEGDTDGEQNLYLARMNSPISVTGPRYRISQPREDWERIGGGPFINEAPEAIKDPNGQLHIVYSANHSWQDQYCLGDLRLKTGGDPTYVWDWHKSDGCLFGSNGGNMMKDWYPTLYANGPGHHTFVLPDGDINSSPSRAYPDTNPLMYHAVPKGAEYKWDNRVRYIGAFTWYNNINYNRCCVPGDNVETGYSPMFFEDPRFAPNPPPAGPPPGGSGKGRTGIRNADPSVIRVGGTYISAEIGPDGHTIDIRQASSPAGLGSARPLTILQSGEDEMWAPEIQLIDGLYYIYYSAASPGGKHYMAYMVTKSPDNNNTPDVKLGQINLPSDKWAVDGNSFVFDNKRWFVWSGWEGDENVEQNLYIARMGNPTTVIGPRFRISQPREPWERVTGGGGGYPLINEAPNAIKDPSGQLHIVYSANGSWSDQYCLADLRLKAGGDPTKVWDWYKSNGCLFGSNRDTMMKGWDPTLYVNGPGSQSFVLENGDIGTSPPAGPTFPLMYHAVPKGTPYSWANRMWFAGTFQWYAGSNYTRCCVPGETSSNGWGLKFYEDSR